MAARKGLKPNCEVLNKTTGKTEICQFKKPELSLENEKALWLFNKIMPIIYSGFGGINATAIESAFKIYNIPFEEQAVLFERIIRFAEEFKKQGDKKSAGEQDRDKTDRKR